MRSVYSIGRVKEWASFQVFLYKVDSPASKREKDLACFMVQVVLLSDQHCGSHKLPTQHVVIFQVIFNLETQGLGRNRLFRNVEAGQRLNIG